MLGVSSGLERNSGDAAAERGGEVGATSFVPGEGVEESGGGGGGGNRWPREETLALLKIRSEMDVAFRDSSHKGPLWEEVSRKMAELGFQRSAKKCKEKFENVYKYHKRTKDGRASKSDGKTYRFFDQLQALDNSPPLPSAVPPPPRHPQPQSAPPQPMPTTVSMNILPVNSSPNFQPLHQPPPPPPAEGNSLIPPFHQTNVLSYSTSSSSTSSDEDIQRRRGKKRKWKDFFNRLMREVIQKQEEMQKFLETLEKREHDRLAREEAWRVQEISRINREHEILAQERSMAAAKDAAVIAFLQKVSDQHNLQIPITTTTTTAPIPTQPPPPPQQHSSIPQPPPPIAAPPLSALIPIENRPVGTSSSRWPKSEVQALIQLRMNLEVKYQEGVPKGPLWEEISSAMAKIGYNRSAKRCKEKWENINKYFKKVKESNKKRPQDAKTCPYYHLLDAIYKEKAKNEITPFNLGHTNPTAPIMALPEQQWPQDNNNNNNDNDHTDVDEEEDYDDDNNNDAADSGDGYEIVTNKATPPPPPPPVTNAAD